MSQDISKSVSPVFFKLGASQQEIAIETAVKTVMDLIKQGHSCQLTLSAGKDSTTTTLLGLEAIRRCKELGIRQAPHFVSSSSTSVESPEIENMLLAAHDDIATWVERHDLPVTIKMVGPNAAAKFVSTVIGQGKLPRFVENGSKGRSCSIEWKVKPQQRLAKQIRDEVLSQGYKEPIAVLGTRLDESAVRGAAMIRRGDQAQTPSRNPDGFLTLSLIADWTEADVWDFLVLFLDGQEPPFDGYAQGDTVRRMLELYRDGNSGTCGMFLSDGMKAPCGSRFGCFSCTITGQKDRSMDSLLESDSKYEYMRGLNNFRNYLIATQWDLSKRELVGRTISAAGYLPVRPDTYNLATRKDLLGYLLTLDELERERAEQVEADIATGKLQPTAENLRMADPQFELVNESDIVLIDFFWSMHHFCSGAFPALQMWFEVKTLGRRYPIPELSITPKGDGIPAKKWFPVGAFDKSVPTDGLRDYKAEMWNPYLHPERATTHFEVGGKRVVWHDESEGLTVDATEALVFVETYCNSPMPVETQLYPAIESARFWLNQGILKLHKGTIGKYQHMAKRGQYFAHLLDRLNLTPSELDAYLQSTAIDDKIHALLVGNEPQDEDLQFALFD